MNLKKDYLEGLEILRFLTMIGVLFWHYQHFSYNDNYQLSDGFDSTRQPFYEYFSFFYNFGFYGPEIFWCISGFIFFYIYADSASAKKFSFKFFFSKRFARLYPAHLVTLLIVCFLQALIFKEQNNFYIYENNNLKHFILQFFFISNWGLEDGFSFNGPIWSVSLEIIVYIIFFFFIKNFKTVIAFILAALLFFGFRELNPSLASCLFLFFGGGYLSISKYNKNLTNSKNIIFKNLNLTNIFAFSIFSISIILHYCYPEKYSKIFPTRLIFMSIVLLFCNLDYFTKKLKLTNLFIFLGNLTYSGYLIHVPIQLLIYLMSIYYEFEINYENKELFFFFFTTTAFFSYCSFKYLENPGRKILTNLLIK